MTIVVKCDKCNKTEMMVVDSIDSQKFDYFLPKLWHQFTMIDESEHKAKPIHYCPNCYILAIQGNSNKVVE